MKQVRLAIALSTALAAPWGAYAQGNTAVQTTAQGLAVVHSAAPSRDPNNSPARIDPTYPNKPPPYPDQAQINGEQGNVVLNVRVIPSGKVHAVQVLRSSGFPDLDNAAVEGAFNWHFIPAMEDGDTVSAWTQVTITYQLPTAPAAPPGDE
jgi:periplasmic protein TonB